MKRNGPNRNKIIVETHKGEVVMEKMVESHQWLHRKTKRSNYQRRLSWKKGICLLETLELKPEGTAFIGLKVNVMFAHQRYRWTSSCWQKLNANREKI